jgi:hypothetical protein
MSVETGGRLTRGLDLTPPASQLNLSGLDKLEIAKAFCYFNEMLGNC